MNIGLTMFVTDQAIGRIVPMQETPITVEPAAEILHAARHYWGIEALRPLQEQAIRAGLARRDSLVVMPTGGGKSLCYQIPPVLAEG